MHKFLFILLLQTFLLVPYHKSMASPTPVPTPVQTFKPGIGSLPASSYQGPIGPSAPGFVQGTASKMIDPNRLVPNASGGISYTPIQSQPSVLGASTGGGGGDSRLTQLQKMGTLNPVQQSEYDRLIAELQGGQAQDQRLIDEAYGQSESYLNQAENQLNADYPTIQAEINAQGQLNNQLLDNSKTSALNQTGQQAMTAGQRQESALSKARRLYGELQRGYNQRFGGASSAGEAANEISNQERLRQEGTTRQDYGNTMRAIELQNQEIESNYNTGKLQLQQQTQQALNEAQRDFQNKLLTIAQNKALIGQAKAEARLASLQELRNNIYQINMQNMQFQQQLEAQKQAGQQQLQQFSTQSQSAVGAGQSATDAYNPNIQSNLQTSSIQFGQNTPLQLYGNISSGRKDELNKYNPGLTF